jgi:hypothetical protein
MSEFEKNRATEPLARREKKPYQKPAFEYEEVFETMALACAKTSDLRRCKATLPLQS